jgi:hypothetical protein
MGPKASLRFQYVLLGRIFVSLHQTSLHDIRRPLGQSGRETPLRSIDVHVRLADDIKSNIIR